MQVLIVCYHKESPTWVSDVANMAVMGWREYDPKFPVDLRWASPPLASNNIGKFQPSIQLLLERENYSLKSVRPHPNLTAIAIAWRYHEEGVPASLTADPELFGSESAEAMSKIQEAILGIGTYHELLFGGAKKFTNNPYSTN